MYFVAPLVLGVVETPVLFAALGLLASLASSVLASEGIVRIARHGARGVRRRWRVFLYLWPAIAVGPVAVVVFVWSPGGAVFPAREFYTVTAQVIPFLLIGLMVERHLVTNLTPVIRAEFICVLLAGEAAAFIGLSGVFANSYSQDDPYVGGSAAATGLLATLAAGALVAAGLLAAAAIRLRADPATTT
jgi:hypothetical protein